MFSVEIFTKRQPPPDLRALERLLIRLPSNHEKFNVIEDKVYQLRAGYAGEVEVDQVLPEIGLPKEAIVLKDLRLEILPNYLVQIDTLLIVPQGMILLEVKKYASETIYFNEEIGKTIKISQNNVEARYDCAVHQVDRSLHGLKMLLHPKFPDIPIMPFIIMANSKTTVAQYPQSIPVKYLKQLPKTVRNFLNQQPVMTHHKIQKTAKFLTLQHQQRKFIPICERYHIHPEALKRGVFCTQCDGKMIVVKGKTWTCTICKQTNASAVHDNLQDWFYLINEKAMTAQLKTFLQISSNTTIHHILKKSPVQKHGKSKATYYKYQP